MTATTRFKDARTIQRLEALEEGQEAIREVLRDMIEASLVSAAPAHHSFLFALLARLRPL